MTTEAYISSFSTETSGDGKKFCGGFAARVEAREEKSEFQKEVSFKIESESEFYIMIDNGNNIM